MRYTMQKSWYLVVVALALMFLATGPLAAQPTTTFNLTSAGSGANLGGVYTSPYDGTVSPGGPTIPVICDDYIDDSYVPEQWTAYVTSLSSLTSGTTLGYLNWLNTSGSTITVDGYSLNQAKAYTVAAYLAGEILQSGVGSMAQEDLSFAMWGLFDPAALTTIGSPDQGNATTDLKNAVLYVENNNLGPSNYANVTIYSYDPASLPTCGGAACPTPRPQEFIVVSMAEPPSTALLGLDLLAVAGLMLFVRRRLKLTQA
jgi:hypothetical protein